MFPETKVLALYFDGPMQSWGISSRYNRRTTLPYPTKSGVTGILCAAMGIERTDQATLEKLAKLSMEMLVFEKQHQLTRWVDYHTVGGGYDPGTERGFIPTIAQNDKPRGTVLTDREYLADTAFGVVLAGEVSLLRRCEAGLADPKWGVWLGRKCCLPADVIYQGLHSSRDEAVDHLTKHSGGRVVRLVREVDRFEDGTDTLMDVPLVAVFDSSQRNQPRRVWTGSPDELKPEDSKIN